MKALAENLATLQAVTEGQTKLRNVLDTAKRVGRTQERIRAADTQADRERECDEARAASKHVPVRLLLKTPGGVLRFVYRGTDLIEYEGVQPTGAP